MFHKSIYILWSWMYCCQHGCLLAIPFGSFSLVVGIPIFLYHYLLSHSIYVEALLYKRYCCKSTLLQAILLARMGGMLLGHPMARSYAQTMGSTLYICMYGTNSCPNMELYLLLCMARTIAQNSLCHRYPLNMFTAVVISCFSLRKKT
jgi:hypothetical protein